MGEITLLLQRSHQGDVRAASDLMQLVYAELRTLAAAKLSREPSSQTLQPTALVHEAWLRLGGDAQPNWQNRRHFFGAAAEAMRRILIEQARRRGAARHGGGLARGAMEELNFVVEPANDELLAIDEALGKLAAIDAGKAELVKLRFFGGLTLEESAQAMDISLTTAKRWWLFARTWLLAEIQSGR